jgi:hypothetical protein
MPGADETCRYRKVGLSQQACKSHPKPAQAIVVKAWEELVPIFCVL